MTLSIIALLAFAVIQIYDAWSTITIIRGGGREANPIVAWLINRIGLVPAVVGLKAICIAGLAGVVWFYGHLWPVPVALACVSAVYLRLFWNHNFKHDGI